MRRESEKGGRSEGWACVTLTCTRPMGAAFRGDGSAQFSSTFLRLPFAADAGSFAMALGAGGGLTDVTDVEITVLVAGTDVGGAWRDEGAGSSSTSIISSSAVAGLPDAMVACAHA